MQETGDMMQETGDMMQETGNMMQEREGRKKEGPKLYQTMKTSQHSARTPQQVFPPISIRLDYITGLDELFSIHLDYIDDLM